ncbi:hypothetical protein [Chitinimonas sp. BJYL2]|uniref:hypothetical protein n=1 Tax=Chitinimonas sp. BJYL2 TaxID=2976696 RepID=UPI0022B37B2A|nr:hypothetical protein [Chitinimonas sp. BJYL2]
MDSIIQLYEGRTLHFISFNPPLMSVLLGILDKLGGAPEGFVVLSALLLSSATWLALAPGRSSPAWRLVLAGLLVLNPIMLLYTGIVWKDVLLAHVVVLAFLIPARLQALHGLSRWSGLAALLVLMTIMVGVRQQGILFAVALSLLTAWQLYPRRLIGLLVAALMIAVPPALNSAIGSFAHARGLNALPPGGEVGLKILMRYDLVGMLSQGAPASSAISQPVLEELQANVPKYSSRRVDTLDGPEKRYWDVSLVDTSRIWLDQVRMDPAAYLSHRAEVWLSTLGWYGVSQCLPYHRGIAGPINHPLANEELTGKLGLAPHEGRYAQRIHRAVTRLADTPLYRHWYYLLVACGLVILYWRRRDWAATTLLSCTIAFVGSYALIGIACDFRYNYTLLVTVSLLAARALAIRAPSSTSREVKW